MWDSSKIKRVEDEHRIMASSSLPFPVFKTTGDEKNDVEVFVEDLIDYCIMNNWYDASKETAEEKWINTDKSMACLRASLPPAVRTVYKYSLGLSEAELKKPHRVVQALKEYYGASIGVSGERQKFLSLMQQENESISAWESRVRNQGAQCEYGTFADELMRDQFIAGVVSEPLRVKLIGKGHRHREGSQAKVTLREVVETAKAFETTTITNELMKSARVSTREQVNYSNKGRSYQADRNTNNEQCQRDLVLGARVSTDNLVNNSAQHTRKSVTNVIRLDISPVPVGRVS